MKRLSILFLSAVIPFLAIGQGEDKIVKSIFDEALSDTTAFSNLRTLCSQTPGRLTGSPAAAAAVEYTKQVMEQLGFDTVYLQPVMVPHWVRGGQERGLIVSGRFGNNEVAVAALGLSIGTGGTGIKSGIVEVKSFEELAALGKSMVEGKIVFFNKPMNPTMVNTFNAYSDAAFQRSTGAAEAAKYGAIGVVVRSLTTATDNYPHTGVMRYQDSIPKIPAFAISTIGANLLSSQLKADPALEIFLYSYCKTHPDVRSYNVIGEIKGSKYPQEIITVGGHLDSWDSNNCQGAHDDGAGCMQSIEVLRIFKKLGIRPQRTIRAVMFMDEEIKQRGGKEYALQAKLKNEKHWFALESDRGGCCPGVLG